MIQRGPTGITRGFRFLRDSFCRGTAPMNERAIRARRAADKPNGQADKQSAKPPIDRARIAAAVREILLAVGEDPEREGLLETPERVARMYEEMFAGMRSDPAVVLRK